MCSAAGISDSALAEIKDIDITLMTLRKPTDLKRVIDSIPKPVRCVPKNGLPMWYKLGLESKLPMPKMPTGKIVFSRGKIGEDVRRLGLGGPQPSFDLTDPYCYNVSYEYVAEHDPHLTSYFQQKPARRRMTQLGYVTKDGRAVCTLKDFNQYRKYLYNQFMDRIHVEIRKLDERSRDDIVMKRVDRDVARRQLVFIKRERALEHRDKVAQEHADEWAEKKRLAKEHELKVKARLKYLAEFKERQRSERAAKAHEKETRIKQRVQAAAELELRRKIIMLRTWRSNEKKRINRQKQEREDKARMQEEYATMKWKERIQSQNRKINEETLLLKLYVEDMTAGSNRRIKRAEIQAYGADLELQRIRLANLKLMHGGHAKAKQLVRKMGVEFEKSKRGAKGMSPELANRLAVEAMANAVSTAGDALMILGQARARMDMETVLPSAVLGLIDEILEMAIMEMARRRVTGLLCGVERKVRAGAAYIFFQNFRDTHPKRRKKEPRWTKQVKAEMVRAMDEMKEAGIGFGEFFYITPEEFTDIDMKSVKDRPPTPVPSKTKLAEMTFSDRVEDLPDPVAVPAGLPQRKKLFVALKMAQKLLTRTVTQKVEKGMDVIIGKVTLPHLRHSMEWGEAVEGLSNAVVDDRISATCVDVRQTSEYLAHRILSSLYSEMKAQKKGMKAAIMEMSKEKESVSFNFSAAEASAEDAVQPPAAT